MAYVFTWNVDVKLWNMTIACALRRGVAFVGVYSTGRGSPYMGKISSARSTSVDSAYSRP